MYLDTNYWEVLIRFKINMFEIWLYNKFIMVQSVTNWNCFLISSTESLNFYISLM